MHACADPDAAGLRQAARRLIESAVIASTSILVFLSLAQPAAAQTEPRSVFLLHSFERDYGPFDVFTNTLRTELSRQSTEPLSFVEVSLQPARFSQTFSDGPIVEYIRSTLAGRQLDLVVSIGGPAMSFARQHRQLFGDSPMLMAAVDRRFLEEGDLGPRDTVVAVENDPAAIIEDVLRLRPETRNIFIVIGTSQLERFWRVRYERDLQRFAGRLTVSWSDALTFPEVLARSSSLPPQSAIFYPMFSQDAKGVAYTEARALAELHAVANAPIFGLHSTQLGSGVVGGPVMDIEGLGHNAVRAALRLLSGEPPDRVTTPVQRAGPPLFDWRELRRWNIGEERLTATSQVLFRTPSIWARYKWQILAGSTVFVLEGLLVALLVLNQVKRRRSERSLRESEARFHLLSDAAPVMVWMAGADRQFIDVNRPFTDFTGRPHQAELGNGWTANVHPDDLSRCLQGYEQAFQRREPFRMEYRLRRHDGDFRWVLATGVPRFLPGGSFAGYIGSAVDVTELQLARVALSGLNRRLMSAQRRSATGLPESCTTTSPSDWPC